MVNRFAGNGIVVQSNGNTIAGNFVGVNPAGTLRMPNGTFPNSGDGIRIENASNNQIGTTAPADRNIVSGNAIDGIHIIGTLAAPATGNVIRNNFVGVAADGKSSVGNRTEPGPAPGAAEGNNLFGIEISGGNDNTVGGTTAGARNVVGLNGSGIEIDNGGQSNIIRGNFVGVGADGVTPAGNLLHGIDLRSSNGFGAPLGPPQANEPGVSNNLIGGTVAGAGNLVAFNGTGGIAVFGNPVSVSGDPNVRNAILGNSIFLNGRNSAGASSAPTPLLGIDLTNGFTFPRDDGFTANDSQGHGTPNAPNNFQNFPVLTSATTGGGMTNVTGTLSAAANTTYRFEFFANDVDPLGLPAEGQQFLGFVNAMTDAAGTATLNATLNGVVTNGRLVTATATDPVGNTSEFSTGLPVPTVAPQPQPQPQPQAQPQPQPQPQPAAQSTPPPFVSAAFGPTGEVLLVTFADGGLVRFDATGARVLSTGGVRSAGVSFGPAGEVLLVTFADGTLVRFDAGGTRVLGRGIVSASLAFDAAGEMLLTTFEDGALVRFDSRGVNVLSLGGIRSASVAIGPAGEVLLVTLQDGTLLKFDTSGARAMSKSVRTASVAFQAGREVLDVIFADGSLTQYDATGIRVLGKV